MHSMIKSFGANHHGTDYAVGDIHGCFSKLEGYLETFFDRTKDRLFAVGDLVDRGPESERAEEFLAYPWFHAVKGNHDDMAERWPEGNMVGRHYSMNGGAWNILRTPDQQIQTALVMAELPLAIEVETAGGLVGIVHAECPPMEWSQFRAVLQHFGELSRKDQKAIEEHVMWCRDRITEKNAKHVQGVRAVICGHTPVQKPLVLGNVHYIDTGACFDYRFTFINLETLETFS
ncbi:metallophosphoesterase [Herbaspirillum huttiense F1]|uniref:metallophosphoesterase n=1 Tax=Herbaspirillum huttiense TaxID=863372 RepID=UPI002888D52C|nr:metallophosphoesterase [Herbaspirillum huttiense]MDT0355671.1 metallophosphoesterase [Herbaspirillum huttiense F1]